MTRISTKQLAEIGPSPPWSSINNYVDELPPVDQTWFPCLGDVSNSDDFVLSNASTRGLGDSDLLLWGQLRKSGVCSTEASQHKYRNIDIKQGYGSEYTHINNPSGIPPRLSVPPSFECGLPKKRKTLLRQREHPLKIQNEELWECWVLDRCHVMSYKYNEHSLLD